MTNYYAKFYIAVVAWSEEKVSKLRSFFTWETEIGKAIDKIKKSAKRQKINRPIVHYLDPYDFDKIANNDISTDDNGETYFSNQIYSFPKVDYYKLPYGVISSCIEG